MATMINFDPTNWGGRGGTKYTAGGVSSGDAGRGWHVPNTRDRSTYDSRYASGRLGTSSATDEHVRNPYNWYGNKNNRSVLIDIYRANRHLEVFRKGKWWIADQIMMKLEQDERLNRLWEDKGWTWQKAFDDLFAKDPDYWAKNMGDQWSNFTKLYSCDLNTPCITDFRPDEHFIRAAYVVPVACPSGCENHGASYGQGDAGFKAAAAAAAPGQYVTKKPSFSAGSTSVHRVWRKVGTGNYERMPMPLRRTYPLADPAPDLMPGRKAMPGSYVKGRVDIDGRLVAKPSVRPSTDITFSPAGPPTVTKGEHISRPDKDPTRKGRGLFPMSLIIAIKLMRSLTELKDAINAWFKGLPRWYQKELEKKYGGDWIGHLFGLVESIPYVSQNADTFNRIVDNLVENQIQDAVIGRLLGANWRTGVRSFDDQYGSSAWVDASFEGAFNNDFSNPVEVHRNY